MEQRNALDTFPNALPRVREAPALLFSWMAAAQGLKTSRPHVQPNSRKSVDGVLTLLVWLVTLLVLPAAAGLAKLLAS